MSRLGPWTVRLCRWDERATTRFLAEHALVAERRIDVEHDGVRRRFAFDPCGDAWCAEAMLGIANTLLDESRAPVRLARDRDAPYVLRVRVEAAAGR